MVAAKRGAKPAAAAATKSGSKKQTPAAAVEQEAPEHSGSGSDHDDADDGNDDEEEDEEHSASGDDDDDGDENDDDNDDEAEQSGSDAEPQSDDDDGDDGLDLDADAQDDEDDEDGEALDAVGFGDAMSKILGQSVAADAQPILAKRTTARMREIAAEKKTVKTARISAAEKREKEQKGLVMPSVATAAQDRRLRQIATKGVVALFNAIEKHQHGKKTDEKSDKKVKEMSKDNFLGLLKAQQKAVASKPAAAGTPAASKSSWSVVQDDFMMGAKLKDWDATHGTEVGRVRKDDGADAEAAEDAAWRQVGDFDSDDDAAGGAKAAPAAKRKSAQAAGRKPAAKKSKRS